MARISRSISIATTLLASTIFVPVAIAGNFNHNSPRGGAPNLVPSGANAGECFARVKVPAQFSTQKDHVIVEEGYTTMEVSQPQLASRQEQVMVKEASVRYEVKQPRYSTVSEKMMVRPAYDKLSVSPPSFSTVTESFQVSAPRVVWKRGNPGALAKQGYTILSVADAGIGGGGYSSTTQYGAARAHNNDCGSACEIWCLVREPGETVNFNRKVMTSPGRVNRTSVPPKFTHISKQVVADPGGVREIPIPAEYKSVTVEDVVDPGGERPVNVPPTYGDVLKKTLVSPERFEWRRVVCAPGTGTIGGAQSSSYGSGYSSGASTSGYSSSAPRTYSGGSHSNTNHSGGSYTSGSSHSGITYGGTTSQHGGAHSSTQSITYGGEGAGNGYESGTYTSDSYTSSGDAFSAGHPNGGSYYYGTDEPVAERRPYRR